MAEDPNPDSRAYAPRSAEVPNIAGAVGRGMVRYAQIDASTLKGRALTADPDAALAAGKGMAAIGDGLQNLGEAGARLEAKVTQAKSITAENEADMEWLRVSTEARVKMDAEPNPDKWGEIAREAVGQFNAAMEGRTMPGPAKDIIKHKMGGNHIRFMGEVAMSANKEHLNRANRDTRARMTAYAAINPDQAREENRKRTELGFQTPGEEMVNNQQIDDTWKGEQFKQQANETIRITREEGPAAGRKYAESLTDADEIQKERLLAKVDEKEREAVAQNTQEFTDAVARGVLDPSDPSAVISPKQVKEWRSWDPNVTDAMRARMMDHVNNMRSQERREFVQNNAPYLASLYYAQAQDFNFKRDGLEKYMELRQKIAELPPGIEGEVSGVLEKKFPGRGTAVPETVTGDALKYLKTMLDRGRFGSFDNGQGYKMDEDGNRVTVKSGAPGEVHIRDEKKYLNALSDMAKVGDKFIKWAEENPEKAKDPDERKKYLTDITAPYFRLGISDDYDEITGAQGDTGPPGEPVYFQGGRITSFGYSNDETPDRNSSAGIGAWVPDAEADKIRKGEASNYKLKAGDIAVSPDVEMSFLENGIKPGDTVTLTYNDGTTHTGRWMDRTANDTQAKKLGLNPLRGRFDIYSPDGRHSRDGNKIASYRKGGAK